MTGPESYARRVRARPYGPREAETGGVAIWFHGPFAVLTLTDGTTSLTFRADLDVSFAGADLRELFTAAGKGETACLRHPELLIGELSLADDGPTGVRGLAVQPGAEGVSLTVRATDLVIEVVFSTREAARLGDEIRRWTNARRA